MRLASVTYPTGRVILYGYGTSGGLDDLLGRVVKITDNTDTRNPDDLTEYAYNGLGRLVQSTLHTSTAVTLDYYAEETPTAGSTEDTRP